ncbi:MAG: Asp-tRNA(Asn)/Glu-tRNA(Gln) amidotransferase subunit GatB [Alphaproteobacteria bacterium]|nr:Asp-tRNA(Asn)/Glu-tRNA(Gln) amidotransferase subunit GatB [Alphaproteobacteria bacterium]
MTALDVRSARKDQLIAGETGDWEVIVGLEVHAQVTSKAKLFSGASAEYGGSPNTHVSLVDAAMPGMLPVINKFCVEQAVRTGLGLKAQINARSRFDRKNYFYPDLPQGYQISQFQHPIVGEGEVEIEADGEAVTIRIERLHLEQDAGKSIHDLSPSETFVDLNRAGVALMEIVSRPDMRSSKEAGAYFNKLRSIVRALGTCDGNMEEGSMRADVNVSVRRAGTKEWGTRCEIKNVNSVRFMAQAIEYEARRQIEILEGGGTIDQETRLFDPDKGETRTMRSKEDAHDYRYFPDPDLLPLVLEKKWIEEIRASLPELPDAKKKRFEDAYGLSPYDAGVLAGDADSAAYFETVANGRDAKLAANWVTQEVFGALNKAGLDLAQSPVSAAQLGALIDLIKDGTINGKIAKDVFAKMMETGDDPGAIVEREGLKQVTDSGAILKAIDDLIAANPDKIEDLKKNPKAFGWWVGQVMKATGGKANPAAVNALLKQKLPI